MARGLRRLRAPVLIYRPRRPGNNDLPSRAPSRRRCPCRGRFYTSGLDKARNRFLTIVDHLNHIFKDKKNHLVGYLRLPSYVPENTATASKEFSAIINKFESETDGLIIDQVNNPGGSIYYLYGLASMLSDQPLMNPLHKMAINQKMIEQAHHDLEELSKLQTESQSMMKLQKFRA